ncbi:MAG: hypothetical protein WED10_05595 [Brumimicrobium sp.]
MTKQRVYKTHVSKMYWDKRGFIKMDLLETQNPFDLAEAIRQSDISREITGDTPFKLLIDTRKSNAVPDKNSQEFASNQQNKIAEAIIVDALPMRILAKFYVKQNSRNPVKIFSNEDEAVEWLINY